MSAGKRPLRLGTRSSQLAMWQAHHVAGLIRKMPDAPEVELITIKTEGDLILDVPLSSLPGKNFFTREIETALLEDRIDLAVHSLKDLATDMPAGLMLGAVLEREDPRDVLLSKGHVDMDGLPRGARVGTSSLRRIAFLRRWRPDIEVVDLRGNVPTRIRKLEEGQYDAIVLAAAGVKRLGLGDHISSFLPLERILPAVGQGAVAIQVRQADANTLRWVQPLEDAATRSATGAERALLHELEGGCQIPLGSLAVVTDGKLTLSASICDTTGNPSVDGQREGSAEDCESIGSGLARDLFEQGGEAILKRLREPGS
jgi:hydroxymethylbilane synthase